LDVKVLKEALAIGVANLVTFVEIALSVRLISVS
jgi:hypothetical protein